MSALDRAKEICSAAVVGTPMHAEFLLHALAALVVEAEATLAPPLPASVDDATLFARLANWHGTRSYVMDGQTGCTHQGWGFRPEQLAEFVAAVVAHKAKP